MPVSVTATTADDSATDADDDYEPASSVVDFGGGEDTATFTVVVNGDTDFEPDETFVVNLTAPVGLSNTDSQGVGTIDNDDDPPPGSVAVTIDDVAMPEGDAGTADFVFTLTLSAAAAAAVDLDVTLI